MEGGEKMSQGKEERMAPFNKELLNEISIDELETRLELAEAPKTCGQYTNSGSAAETD